MHLKEEKKNKISLNIITTSNSLCSLLRDDFKHKLEKITYNLQMNTKSKRAVSKRWEKHCLVTNMNLKWTFIKNIKLASNRHRYWSN